MKSNKLPQDSPLRADASSYYSTRLQTPKQTSVFVYIVLILLLALLAVGAIGIARSMPEKIDSINAHPWMQHVCEYFACKRFEQQADYRNLHLSEAVGITRGNTFIFSGVLALKKTKESQQMQTWPQLNLALLNRAGKKILEYQIVPDVYLPEGAPEFPSTQKQPIQFSVETEKSVVRYQFEFSSL